ncbi:aromatic acid exporter family protein [Metabacillus sp. GX 13764]|uniref:aromatic acid exporter family protein n=1 Tax=Metabacillus kandeliae TaxID=2900151 RepID=UPI001E5CD9D4|nr:aromatic acid exporter family protein [Metabacillus kandeliae]MCD7033240.1 aromatic acid exporter family protein [Metabacillus kandeliae]
MLKFRIGYRTIKTALGTALAITLAQLFQLHNFPSAGIITILCIQVTKKRSLQTSWARFLACAIAIVFSFVFFETFGFHPLTIGVMLLFFIPVTVMARVSEGIVTSSVIILHLYASKHITMPLILNELALIATGIGVALVMNLYMPSVDKKLKEYQEKIEECFAKIFCEIESFLLNGDYSWDGKEITEAASLLQEAKKLSSQDVENRFNKQGNLYYHYFKMREKQFEILERVLPILTSISITVEQGEMIADFLKDLRTHIHPGNTAHNFLRKLHDMKGTFEEMPLPKTREEFEARAELFHFVKEMEEYLVIKSTFKGLK